MNSYNNYDDEDDLDMILEFEVESDERTDDKDEGEIGEMDSADDDAETDSDDELEDGEGIGPWMFEPLPQGQNQQQENVGDAQPPVNPERLLNVETW